MVVAKDNDTTARKKGQVENKDHRHLPAVRVSTALQHAAAGTIVVYNGTLWSFNRKTTRRLLQQHTEYSAEPFIVQVRAELITL